MSEQLEPADDLRLPDHLAACEARLAGQALPAVGIDRDELLFRAGWAAAAAARAASASAAATGRIPRNAVAVWSLGSAALAASLTAIVTYAAVAPGRAPESRPGSRRPQVQMVERGASESPPAQRRAGDVRAWAAVDALASSNALSSRTLPPSSLWARVERSSGGRWNEPIAVVDADRSASGEPVMARGMLEELLPGGANRSRRGGAESGIFKLFRPLASAEDSI